MGYIESFEYELHHTDIGNQLLSQYNIQDEIYQSENSRIFKIVSMKDGDILLLKVLKKHVEFEYGIDKAIKLNHKGISKIYDYKESDNYLYIIKEYVEGQDLERYVNERGSLDDELVKEITLMLTDILDYLHNYNGTSIIFRDLKPSNIIVTSDGSVKLIDIITLREINESKDTDTFYVGSRGYSAPEQFGYMQSKPTSDVYSLGATIYFLVTGTHPQVSMDFKEMDVMSPKFARVVRRAMEFNPKDRYASVSEMAKDMTLNRHVKRVIIASLSILMVLIVAGGLYKYINFPKDEVGPIEQQVDQPMVDDAEKSVDIEDESAIETVIHEELAIDPDMFNPLIYRTEEDVDLTQFIELQEGYHFDYLDNRILKVYMRREDMAEAVEDFKYIYVYSEGRPIGEFEAKREIYRLVNDPASLEVYLPVGYEVDLSKADNVLILLFADDYEPLGYVYYNNISFEEEEIARNEVLGTVEVTEGIRVDYYRDFGRLYFDDTLAPDFSKFSFTTFEVSIKDELTKGQLSYYAENDQSAFSFFGEPFTFNWGEDGGFMDYDYVLFLQNDDYEIVKEYNIYNIDSNGEPEVYINENTTEDKETQMVVEGVKVEVLLESIDNLNQDESEGTFVGTGIDVLYSGSNASVIFDVSLVPDFDSYAIYSSTNLLSDEKVRESNKEWLSSGSAIQEYHGQIINTGAPETTTFLENDWGILLYGGGELVGEYYICNLE